MAIESVNPATGRRIKVYEEMGPREVEGILESVHGAFLQWRRTSLPERATRLQRAALVLRQDVEQYSRLMAHEMGKPIR